MNQLTLHGRKNERGQTVVLVALSLFALLAMAALAIDVTTLYIAHIEAQTAADAAALAGAKAFVTSGFTSGNVNVNAATAQALATQAALLAGQQFSVAGGTPNISVSSTNTSNPQNPTISVTAGRTNLPVFFARIWVTWIAHPPTVSATATGEAYNPSYNSSYPLGILPVPVAGVKPWLVPNCVPGTSSLPPDCSAPYFVNTNGSLASGAIIGQSITLSIQATQGPLTVIGNNYEFYPLDIPAVTPSCPQTYTPNGPPWYYEDDISCFNPSQVMCSAPSFTPPSGVYGPSVNGPSDPVFLDSRIDSGGVTALRNDTDNGIQYLIHATGPGLDQGQDIFTPPPLNPVTLITPGNGNPDGVLIKNNPYISRSDSVVNVPLFDGTDLCSSGTCSGAGATNIVGFLQIGITDYPSSGSIDAIVLNAIGCASANSGTSVSGGGLTPIPVRLVQ